MKIECNTTFLDGIERFENGDVRTVDDERGAYFVSQGWARDLTGEVVQGAPAVGDVTLDTHDSTVGHTVTGADNG